MCTLSWIQHQDSYSLVFNRDELNSRQRALPPALKTADDGSLYLSPTDTDAGGSWLQVNEHGLTACLLNYYAADRAPSDDVHSRGEIVLMLTGCRSIAEAEVIVKQLNTSHYRGFDLVLMEANQRPVQYRWDAVSLTRHLPEIPLTSSSYRTQEVCDYRRELFLRSAPRNLQQLLAFHDCHDAEASAHLPPPSPAHAPCMHRADAKTVSQCVVEVNPNQVSIRYADGSPCRNPLSAPLQLDRASAETMTTNGACALAS
ncbi:NRDE family protein [Porticoccus sp. W117]|uniref:NRDE family protein n=1 Tax=Porticoccus sp. W117 TaxID=3054777 RepID=UPI00259689C8|nr:NRDE family protein [Porticoccus sp. W117]MDM3871613.1 NRDE family protein [Porticoccus sp. W117]